MENKYTLNSIANSISGAEFISGRQALVRIKHERDSEARGISVAWNYSENSLE